MPRFKSQFANWKRAVLLVWRSSPFYTTIWALFVIIQGLLPGLTVYLTKFAIDGVLAAQRSGGSWEDVRYAIALLILIGIATLLGEVLKYFYGWIRTAQAEYVANQLTDTIHQKAVEIDIAFYESAQFHDLLEQATGDSSGKPLALLESLGSLVQNSVTMIAMAAILVGYSWWLPILLVVGTLPAFYVSVRTDRKYHKWWRSTSNDRRWSNYYNVMLTHDEAAKELRLFDLGSHFRGLYQSVRSKLRIERLEHLKKQSYGKALASLIGLLSAVAGMAWMAFQVFYKNGTLGDLVVFYQIFSQGRLLMSSLLGSVGKTFDHSLYLESLFEYLDLEPEITSPENPVSISPLNTGIEFKSVTFYYPNSNTPALKNFSLSVPAGEIVSLVGVNGSGKSTLIKLLSRFYDPNEGSIEIGGVDIREFDLAELRSSLSVLFQFPIHYHATAAANISLGDVNRDENLSKIREAAEKAGSHDFISKLPEKYETLLGKWFVDGMELSGGEWQRLALTRAYYRRSPVVVLDEPTSFMDSWAEGDWFERFRSMAAGKTGIVITHRFTIAMKADTIHVINEGSIVESGTHKELLELDGLYAESWKSQMSAASELES